MDDYEKNESPELDTLIDDRIEAERCIAAEIKANREEV
jgi:hypothetical protein